MARCRFALLVRAFACTALCSLSACPGTLDNKESFLVDAGGTDNPDSSSDACGDVVTRIFAPSCGSSGCHGGTAPQQSLDLVSSGLAARVVGARGKTCSGTLADPENPAGSLLYTKLLSPPACGAQMPLAQAPLSSADAACVLAWIAAQ
jgi:hypothetical protein